MSITTVVSPDEQDITIKVTGKFDFLVVQEFRRAYSDKSPAAKFTVDLADTIYLDSSALGMLVHLWKYIGQDRNRIKIVNSNADIKKIFDITHFDKNFVIS